MLHADQLLQDPRVSQAKKLLLDAVQDHSKTLTKPTPSKPELAEAFAAQLEKAAEARGRPMYLPYLSSGIGNGPFVELTDGSVKMDLISGIGVHVLGHSHPALIEAGIDAALGDTVMQGNLQMNPESIELAQQLVDLANLNGAEMAHCFLSTSGAMANENALKILFQKQAPAHRLLAFRGAFAGRSLATCRITDRPEYRKGLPETISVDHIPYFDPARPEESTRETLAAIDELLAAHPGEYAAMVFELIIGEGGFYPGNKEFFETIMTRLREANILIFMDEVQSFGRTSQPFAYQHFGLDRFADVTAIGKMTQVCATIYKADLNPDPALLSQTFTGSTSSIYAGLAIVKELRDGGYFGPEGKIMKLGNSFNEHLQAIAKRHPELVSGPYGLGGMVSFTPLDGQMPNAVTFVKELFQNGIMGFPAGKTPARVRFLLPYGVLEESHIDMACERIESTLLSVSKQLS